MPPLAGFALPYSDGEIGECHVLPPVTELSARYRDTILREAERVAKKVSTTLAPNDGEHRIRTGSRTTGSRGGRGR